MEAAPYFDLNEVEGISISLRTRHQICDFALTILRLFCSPYINIMAIFAAAKKKVEAPSSLKLET